MTALPSRTAVLRTTDGRQHVLLRVADRDLQLALEGADVEQPVHLRVDAIWPVDQLRYRINALECLNALRATGQFPGRLYPAEARGNRLRFVLQALDASLIGASHREIAAALLGVERVAADWGDPGDHLRDRIRRAIRRGQRLMNGEYLEFLV